MKIGSNLIPVLVLVAVCALGWTALGQRHVAPAIQWEYTAKLVTGYPEASPAIFTDLGVQGWELVAVADGRAYFKRPKK